MAYVLGFLYADGNITETSRDTYYTAVYSSDRSLISAIRKLLESNHTLSPRHSETGTWYRFQIGSKQLFTSLLARGLKPNKTARITLPNIPSVFFGDFVAGFFDGDGNVWSGSIHLQRLKPVPVLQVSFTSASIDFLEQLHRALQARGIAGGSLRPLKNKQCARLTFGTHDALKLYRIMYNRKRRPFLARKRMVFERYIRHCGRSSTG